MKEYALFAGCTISSMLTHLEAASRKVLARLDLDLVDLPFTCCPTSGLREIDNDTWLVMAARNLAVAENAGLDIITLCNGCTQSLKEARRLLEDRKLRASTNKRLAQASLAYSGTVQVRHFAEALYEMRDRLETLVDGRLADLRVASHPGCHLLRPSDVMGFDDPERPVRYEQLIESIGATPVEYANKTLCCGFKMFDVDRRAAATVVMDKIEAMAAAAADVIVVGCPSCFTQFDRNQLVAKRMDERDVTLPVLFFLQLLGLALGFTPEEMCVGQHRVKLKIFEAEDAAPQHGATQGFAGS